MRVHCFVLLEETVVDWINLLAVFALKQVPPSTRVHGHGV